MMVPKIKCKILLNVEIPEISVGSRFQLFFGIVRDVLCLFVLFVLPFFYAVSGIIVLF